MAADPRLTPLSLSHGGRTLRGWQWEPVAGVTDAAPRVLLDSTDDDAQIPAL